MKKILIYISIFFAVGTIFTATGLMIIDNFIYQLSQSSVIVSAQTNNSQSEIKSTNKIILPEQIDDLEYSYNNKYYVYLKDSKIYINSIEDGKNIDIIEEEKPICYSKLLYDKNLILYFTQEKSKNTSKLVLNTYEIDTKRKSKYNSVNIYNFSKIKDMNMSPIINIIYFNVETKNGSSTGNMIYRIDLFNNISLVKSGKIYSSMIMLQHKDVVYYEDENSNIYYGSSKLSIFKEKVNMIGIDYDDNLYFINQDDKDIVYKVKNNKIIDKIELSDTDLVKTYMNNYGVYLVYPTYVINVADEEGPYKRIAKLSKYVSFEAIKDDTVYLRTTDDLLITTKVIE